MCAAWSDPRSQHWHLKRSTCTPCWPAHRARRVAVVVQRFKCHQYAASPINLEGLGVRHPLRLYLTVSKPSGSRRLVSCSPAKCIPRALFSGTLTEIEASGLCQERRVNLVVLIRYFNFVITISSVSPSVSYTWISTVCDVCAS